MIDRWDFSLLMHVLIKEAADAQNFPDFEEAMHQLIIYAYEINNPEIGRVDILDVTDEIRDGMGSHWASFEAYGIMRLQFVSFYINDEVILETGRMLGVQEDDTIDPSQVLGAGDAALAAFAKAMTITMRKHGVKMLERLIETEELEGDQIGLAALIKKYLEEEVDETVAKFSQQLDAVFGVAAAIAPDWSPPGGERYDNPA